MMSPNDEDPARQVRELMERAEAIAVPLFAVPLDSVVSGLLPLLYQLAQHTRATSEARRLSAELLMTLAGEVSRGVYRDAPVRDVMTDERWREVAGEGPAA